MTTPSAGSRPLSDETFLLRSSAGIDWHMADDPHGPGATLTATQDVTDILEFNQAQAGHNDGYTKDKSIRRAFSIPMMVQYKWLTEEGLDVFSQDPDMQRRLCKKLDDPEWRYLRTAHFTLGDSWKKFK